MFDDTVLRNNFQGPSEPELAEYDPKTHIHTMHHEESIGDGRSGKSAMFSS
jgi:hypothetical protein